MVWSKPKKIHKNSSSVRPLSQGTAPTKVEPKTSPRRVTRLALGLGAIAVLMGAGGFFFRYGTVQGVPVSVVLKFVGDKPAREAYFSGQSFLLHERLQELEIEEEVKAFYRPQFEDEKELDWYIHQIFYDRTGYIGKAYKVGPGRQLILKTSKDYQYPRWVVLARRAGLIVDQRQDQGTYFVKTPEGAWVLYEEMLEQYPLPWLHRFLRQQKKNRQQTPS